VIPDAQFLTVCLIEKLNLSRCDKIETRSALLEIRDALRQSSVFLRADSDLVSVNRQLKPGASRNWRAHRGSELLWRGASLGRRCRHLPPFAGADFAR
jgi:hypothetical protein